MTHAAVYARLSRDRDGLSTSVADQVRQAVVYCDAHGWTYDLYRDNDVPASEAQARRRKPRPEYARLLRDLEAGRVDAIVVWSVDRLYRHPRDLEDLIDLVERRRVKYVSLQAGPIDLATPTGRMVARILAGVSKGEVETMVGRVRRKHESLFLEGKAHGGPRPFGLRTVAGVTTLDEAEADAIRDAARRILSGEALRSVTRVWNARGLRTSWGRKWQAKAVKGVLTSPRVAGLVERNGQTRPASWPPIVDRRTWNRVRAEFARREGVAVERGSRPVNRKYLLTGLLFCAGCGAALVGHPQGAQRSYTCLAKHAPGQGARPRIAAEPVETALILAALEREAPRPATVADPSTVEARLLGAIDAVQTRLDDLSRARFAEGRIDDSQFMAAQEPLRAELTALEDELAGVVVPAPTTNRQWLRDWVAAGTPDPFADPEYRAELETKVERVDVRPAGRSKWVPLADRIAVVWRR